MTVTVYKSDDTGAPPLTGEAGSLIALLDAILVDGYGSKAAAGWTKETSGVDRAIYRNSPVDGFGYFFQVEDSTAYVPATNSIAYVKGGVTSAGFDSLTEPFGGSVSGYFSGIAKSSSSDATIRPWVVIADSRTLIICVDCYSTGASNTSSAKYIAHYIGDMDVEGLLPTKNAAILGNNHTGAINGFSGLTATDNSRFVNKSSTNTIVSFASAQTRWNSIGEANGDIYRPTYKTYRGKYVLLELSMSESSNRTWGTSGYLRGVYGIAGDLSLQSVSNFDTATMNGRTFMFIRYDEDYDGWMAIEISDWSTT